jgi:hypothetical protein
MTGKKHRAVRTLGFPGDRATGAAGFSYCSHRYAAEPALAINSSENTSLHFFCAPRTVPFSSHFEDQSFVFPRMFEGYENIVAIQQPTRNMILILSLARCFVV